MWSLRTSRGGLRGWSRGSSAGSALPQGRWRFRSSRAGAGGLDEMIISLYAGGMAVDDIQHHLARTIGTELSHGTMSRAHEQALAAGRRPDMLPASPDLGSAGARPSQGRSCPGPCGPARAPPGWGVRSGSHMAAKKRGRKDQPNQSVHAFREPRALASTLIFWLKCPLSKERSD